MKRFAALGPLAIIFTSCAYFQQPKTLGQVKANLDCIRLQNGILWTQISDKFGNLDEAPLPEPSSELTQNIRVYNGKTVIFYTRLEEVKEGERTRFREIITGIEVCKKR
jgi:hypothetical protein